MAAKNTFKKDQTKLEVSAADSLLWIVQSHLAEGSLSSSFYFPFLIWPQIDNMAWKKNKSGLKTAGVNVAKAVHFKTKTNYVDMLKMVKYWYNLFTAMNE